MKKNLNLIVINHNYIEMGDPKRFCHHIDKGRFDEVDRVLSTYSFVGRNNLGEALETAASKGYLDLLKRIVFKYRSEITNDIAYNTCDKACRFSGNVDMVKYCLDLCKNYTIRDIHYHKLLVGACSKGHYEVVKILCESGCEPRKIHPNNCECGIRLIIKAAQNGHKNIVDFLRPYSYADDVTTAYNILCNRVNRSIPWM